MFGTRGKAELNKEAILSRVSQLDIFKHYCPTFEQVGKKFPSVLRKDNDPSCCIIQMPSGVYIYNDFTEKLILTCFGFVQKKFNCTAEESLNIICNDFNLTKVIPNRLPTPSLNYVGIKDSPLYRRTTKLPIKRREWLKSDTYWEDYYIPREILNKYNVVPVSHIWKEELDMLKPIYFYKPSNPAYSYEHGNGLRKILQPYAPKDLKWISNLPRDTYSGWDQLDDSGDLLIITKSLKDVMIWRMAGINAIAPQSESVRPSEGMINLLKLRFNRLLLNFDPDKAGIEGAENWLKFGVVNFNVPNEKDISDLVKARGFDSQEIINLIPNA
jgi:hypothetical protein